ncbi:hypothetical protein EVAR_84452_1 [Eumeta japonica]|uniref:Uncharacterized protein n=1 Tax=Eumeta variegata TaxID=151549 RepID=A0A4C1W1M0_EUMVA|nr:hypothetical protein EVAR_84452_1 [Eumeta japonica]
MQYNTFPRSRDNNLVEEGTHGPVRVGALNCRRHQCGDSFQNRRLSVLCEARRIIEPAKYMNRSVTAISALPRKPALRIFLHSRLGVRNLAVYGHNDGQSFDVQTVYCSTSFTSSGRSTTATDAPNPLRCSSTVRPKDCCGSTNAVALRSKWQTVYVCKTHKITKIAIGIRSVNLRERFLGAETVRELGRADGAVNRSEYRDERKRGITGTAR